MMFANPWSTITRAHPIAWVALIAGAAIEALFTALAFLMPITSGHEYVTLINVNLFGYQIAPLYSLLLWFGSIRYTTLERIRSDPSNAFSTNLLWLSVCAFIAIVPVLVTYMTVVFLIEQRPVDHGVVQTVTASVQLIMELVIIGLVTNIAVNCGLAWGCVAPIAIVLFGVSGWLFSTWNQWIGKTIYFFLEPMPDAASLIPDKVVPFVILAAALISVNILACRHVDYRSA
ncbi:cation efflux system protein [Bifidobacterium pullorum subsp. saeculare DSM 6531 = LMG 14934]|uniref:Cation efflux system protein n=1 Tax=Bifidobacterium pullorum subsp. saeculare DSM 6531 = LMG 14934 TaxID=1437611 RepID=A0A087CU76_9BIFI|nr:hypothetical protein [Bifidobacterium pullorum]KFI86826.1 cation efflux system protein [Bifidobacterium pullorum subsp. saeculare DSM 6531 = LMG 14934]